MQFLAGVRNWTWTFKVSSLSCSFERKIVANCTVAILSSKVGFGGKNFKDV